MKAFLAAMALALMAAAYALGPVPAVAAASKDKKAEAQTKTVCVKRLSEIDAPAPVSGPACAATGGDQPLRPLPVIDKTLTSAGR